MLILVNIFSQFFRSLLKYVTAEIRSHTLCRALVRLYDYKEPIRKKSAELKNLIRKLSDLFDKRDKFIHSEWMISSKTRKVKRIKNLKMFDVDIKEVNNLIEQFRDINHKLTVFMYDWEERHPDPEFEKFLNLVFEAMKISSTNTKP